jgi:hypothetical protein
MIIKQVLVWLVAGVFFFNVGSMVRAADEKLKEETVVGDLQVTFRPLVAFFENGKFHMIVY